MEEHKELLARLDERSFHMSESVDTILDQLKNINYEIAHHKTEIHKIKLELAEAKGVWSGINRTITIVLTVGGMLLGAIATMLWH